MSEHGKLIGVCEYCDHDIYNYGDYKFCSDFCISIHEEKRDLWKELKEGDWGIFPCSRCGLAIEDEFSEEKDDRVCCDCYDRTRREVRAKLLEEVLKFKNFLGEDLTCRIQKELKK